MNLEQYRKELEETKKRHSFAMMSEGSSVTVIGRIEHDSIRRADESLSHIASAKNFEHESSSYKQNDA
jgi:hypothetical protein